MTINLYHASFIFSRVANLETAFPKLCSESELNYGNKEHQAAGFFSALVWKTHSRVVVVCIGSLSFTWSALFQGPRGSKCPSLDTESLLSPTLLFSSAWPLTPPVKEGCEKNNSPLGISRIWQKVDEKRGFSSWKWSISLGKFLLNCFLWVRTLNRLWAY